MKTAQTLVIAGLIASFALPSVAQVKDTQVNKLTEALKQAAPPQRTNDGMYSPWQVLPGIIPSWTKQCVGKEMTPQQFDQDEKSARQTVNCIVKRELNNQSKANQNELNSVRNVACWWMTGNSRGCTQGPTATYVQKVVSIYQKQSSN
jgi:hypothetical protein